MNRRPVRIAVWALVCVVGVLGSSWLASLKHQDLQVGIVVAAVAIFVIVDEIKRRHRKRAGNG